MPNKYLPLRYEKRVVSRDFTTNNLHDHSIFKNSYNDQNSRTILATKTQLGRFLQLWV